MKQPILLDTCAALWIVDGSLSESAADSLTKARNRGLPVYVSPITAWEVGVLAQKGRFRSPHSPQRWFELLLGVPDMRLADLPTRVLMQSSFLPGVLHNDPADRIIAATAREFGFAVMTRDWALLEYAVQGHLSVIEC